MPLNRRVPRVRKQMFYRIGEDPNVEEVEGKGEQNYKNQKLTKF